MLELEMSEATPPVVDQPGSEPAPAEIPAEAPPEGGEKPPEETPPAEPKLEDNAVIRQMRRQLKAQAKEIQALRSAPPPAAPERENFESDAEYISAVVDHKMNQAPVQQHHAGVFEQKYEAAGKAHPDFAEAVEDISHVVFSKESTIALRQAVETLPHGDELLYHIAKNPDLAEEIALLPPAAFAARLGDIHGDIRREKAQKPKPSNAPAPVKPVKPAASGETDYDSMSFADFTRQRAKDREKHRLRFVT